MAIKTRVKRSVENELYYLVNTFEEFILEKEARNLAEPSIRSYRESFVKFCNFFDFNQDTTTEEINKQMFYKWSGTLKLDGLSINSINHYLRDVRAFCYWCMDDDRQYIKPSFKIEMLKVQEAPPKQYTDDELMAILAKPSVRDSYTDWRNWCICNFILATGARASSICSLKIKDVDFKNKDITYYHTKNKKAQVVPLSPSLETCIKEFIRLWRKGVDEDSYMFCNIGEDKLTTNALWQSLAKYTKARGLDKTGVHKLRHTFALNWVKNDGNSFKLQKMLGHSRLDMTRNYVNVASQELHEDFEVYNPLDNLKRKAKRTQMVKRSF